MKVIGGIIAGVMLIATIVMVEAWVFMLAVGALWHETGLAEPYGFVPSLAIVVFLSIVGAIFSGARSVNYTKS